MPETYAPEKIALIFPSNGPWNSLFNLELRRLRENGILRKLLDKYFKSKGIVCTIFLCFFKYF